MASSNWVLYILLLLFVGFIIFTVHVWNNKEYYFEMAGIELPPQLQNQMKRKEKKVRVRPNSKAAKRMRKKASN